MWTLYKTKHIGIGTLCEVKINFEESLISRRFGVDSITVNGGKPRFNQRTIELFYENEKKWLRELESEWIPKTIDICDETKTIIQEFYGEDLLCIRKQLPDIIPDLTSQIMKMYEFFKKKNVFKRNGSLSNLTHLNGQIKAFDFKWAMPRPMGLEKELYSYDNYLVKIDKDLPMKLRGLV